MKAIVYMGSSERDLFAFPAKAYDTAQAELRLLRHGANPTHYRPMKDMPPGVCEIRINIGTAWRVMYVANRKEAIYVLHCFQKKTERTSKKDIDLAVRRYKQIGQ